MGYNEADTRAKLIDPAIHKCGWTEALIRREETAGGIEIIAGKGRRRARGKVDYTLRIQVNPETQPVAVALIEAKEEDLPAGHGLDQAKGYAACERLNVPFVFSSNGHMFVEFDRSTGLTTLPRPIAEFPAPAELRVRYEQHMGFSLAAAAARPLLQPYTGGEATRRYYQDAAIRAVLEKVARADVTGEPKRALLSLATGAGKTFIAVNLLKRIADAGQLKRALFVCDRDELRTQALKAFQNVFGSDAAEVFRNSEGNNNAKNARIHIATYQTLGVDREDSDASFLTKFYPKDYFTHVVIDECQRSAWGKWSEVLKRNANAVQIGLTATPRRLAETLRHAAKRQSEGGPWNTAKMPEDMLLAAEKSPPYRLRGAESEGTVLLSKEAREDAKVSADNYEYFGEPVYEYDYAQGVEDGYLAACEIHKGRINLDETGITLAEILARNPVDAITGQPITAQQLKDRYEKTQYEDQILLPDRVLAMCRDLFQYLLDTGAPEQKTIIFCARDRHADDVAVCMNNLYANWCADNGKKPADFYAFKCTAASSGNDQLPDLRGSSRTHFIATTVDLLTTGVDVPCIRNIVFFKYLKSPISFYQMVGRGTRIDLPTGKLMFRIYDYTDATRLFGEDFITKPRKVREDGDPGPDPPPPPEPTISVGGFEAHVTDAGWYVPVQVDGRLVTVPIEEYKAQLAAKLVAEAATLQHFRKRWIDPPSRQELIDTLVSAGYSPSLVQRVDEKEDYDLYDVLGELGWGMKARTRHERAMAFTYKHEDWLDGLPAKTAATVKAIASQFELGGTESLENPQIFQTPEVKSAGGLAALQDAGRPADILLETKQRMFAA